MTNKAHPGAMAYGHAHAEAFMLMQYECKPGSATPFGPRRPGCGAVEWVWNSRDGVTPFTIDCRACGGEATHARWAEDRYEPGRVPKPGERVFLDMTPERYTERVRAYAERMWDDDRLPAREDGRWATLDEFTAALGKDWTSDSPDLIVWPEPPPPAPRGHYCVVHDREHPEGWDDECVSERDEAIASAQPDEHAVAPELGLWTRIGRKIACLRRGHHEWEDDGPTLGGIWLRCSHCGTIEEFLPGLHEPDGGEAVWQARLKRAGAE